ncbi:hypothetical protein COLO4_35544 [Corchorus olitorius]|uniref:Uncharacterized protein n=1 Tax=Corchorus olitorius TaxID=93759 RepID=A0A1R3GFK6_9ROSI|nr:hypothetical protein COLO4_35544 [Corchorus olitorius]
MEMFRSFTQELTKAFIESANNLDNDQRSQACFHLMMFSEVEEEFKELKQENESLKNQNKNMKEQKKKLETKFVEKEKALQQLEVE